MSGNKEDRYSKKEVFTLILAAYKAIIPRILMMSVSILIVWLILSKLI